MLYTLSIPIPKYFTLPHLGIAHHIPLFQEKATYGCLTFLQWQAEFGNVLIISSFCL